MTVDTESSELLAPLPPVSVLLVDDNQANLIALEAVLRPLGHRLVRALSGEEALRRILEEDFALILMDGQMPGMDGFQTAALIKQRERTRDIPLIFVSAVYREVGDATKGYAVGAADYIVKPFEPELMRAKVAALINEQQRRERLKIQTKLLLAQERRAVVEQAARHAAEEANRLKDEFIAMVSHELRTPLNTIIGWATILRSKHDDPIALAKGLEAIYRNAVIQTELVEDLLDVSRIASQKMRLSRQDTDVAELVANEASTMEETARAREVDLVVTTEPCVAFCDPERIQQVISNLLGNAVKFSPRGGRVELRLTPSGEQVEIQVRDQGIGIPADALAHVFEPFWQGPSGTSKRSAGLGLGLAIVRRLVELHGGTIVAESDGEGLGACFTVRLPRRLQDPQLAPSALRAPADASFPRIEGVRILIVDDETDARDMIGTILEELGARVTVAGSVAGALRALHDARFDALLCDLSMPDEDGFNLMQEIRALGPEHMARIPAIAITAHSDDATQARAQTAGFSGFVAKPFRPASLLLEIARATGRQPPGP